MNRDYCLVIDVWEGQLDSDEAALKAVGVKGMGIRLNDMNGGHHMDLNFAKQWDEAIGFVRFPYFVYNPWVSGQANFDWMISHLPKNVYTIALDVEVRYSAVTPTVYAAEVARFIANCQSRGYKIILYTAQWFLPYLAKWPTNVEYWWAQYPDAIKYFGNVHTWVDLRNVIDTVLTVPLNATLCPGTIRMWQFNADSLIMPGTVRPLDFNIFYGNETELANYFGSAIVPPEEPPIVTPAKNFGWLKPRYVYKGPAIIAASLLPGQSRALIPLDLSGQNFIKKLNTAEVWERIFKAPDVGPTKGINDAGKLIYIMAGWSGNLVKILGNNGAWTQVACIPVGVYPDTTTFNHKKTPWLIHRMTMVNIFNQFYSSSSPYWNDTNDPILSIGEVWIPTTWISNTATVTTPLNVRSGPGTGYNVVGSLAVGTQISIINIEVDASDNIWALFSTGKWCCLKYGTSSYTSWKLF